MVTWAQRSATAGTRVAAVAPEPTTTTRLPSVVQVLGPGLRVDDPAAEPVHPRPLGRVALRVPVVALAHPEEAGREAHRLAGVRPDGLDGPEALRARPARRGDLVPVADVPAEVVLLDDLAHVLEDLGGGRDRRAGPGLEAVAEGVEVAVRPDARVAVGEPGAAEAVLDLEDDEAGPGALLREVVGPTDAGDARADDQHVDVLGLPRRGPGKRRCLGHRSRPFPAPAARRASDAAPCRGRPPRVAGPANGTGRARRVGGRGWPLSQQASVASPKG